MSVFMIRAMRLPLAGLSLALSLGAFAALPTEASADANLTHTSLEQPTAPANSTYKAVIGLGAGCSGAATDRLTVELPEGLIAAQPMPKPGWSLAIETAPYEQTYDYFGTPMTEGVRRIVWSGGSLPDAFYDTFVFRAHITDLPDGTELPIRVIQSCGDAEVAWTESAAPGQTPEDRSHPAPVLKIAETSMIGRGPYIAAADAPRVVTHGPITVSNMFARATPGAATVGAAYLRVRNTGDTPLALITLRGDVAKRIKLHGMKMEDGLMKMEPLDYIMIPSGGTITLQPSGRHVMMTDLAQPLVEGESFPLTLLFDTGMEMTVSIPIGSVGAMSPPTSH
jgi:hypothetical protein